MEVFASLYDFFISIIISLIEKIRTVVYSPTPTPLLSLKIKGQLGELGMCLVITLWCFDYL